MTPEEYAMKHQKRMSNTEREGMIAIMKKINTEQNNLKRCCNTRIFEYDKYEKIWMCSRCGKYYEKIRYDTKHNKGIYKEVKVETSDEDGRIINII